MGPEDNRANLILQKALKIGAELFDNTLDRSQSDFPREEEAREKRSPSV